MLEIGVTQDEINSIRDIMLEDAPVEEEVNDDRVAFDNSDDNTSITLIVIISVIAAIVILGVIFLVIFLKKRRNKEIAVNS